MGELEEFEWRALGGQCVDFVTAGALEDSNCERSCHGGDSPRGRNPSSK